MRATAKGEKRGEDQGVVGAAEHNARSAVSSLTRALAELMLEVIGDYHI